MFDTIAIGVAVVRGDLGAFRLDAYRIPFSHFRRRDHCIGLGSDVGPLAVHPLPESHDWMPLTVSIIDVARAADKVIVAVALDAEGKAHVAVLRNVDICREFHIGV